MSEETTSFSPVVCSSCGTTVGRVRDGRLKIEVRSRLVAVSKSGAEINCSKCRSVVMLPLVYKEDVL